MSQKTAEKWFFFKQLCSVHRFYYLFLYSTPVVVVPLLSGVIQFRKAGPTCTQNKSLQFVLHLDFEWIFKFKFTIFKSLNIFHACVASPMSQNVTL